jgi:hypothetical protein
MVSLAICGASRGRSYQAGVTERLVASMPRETAMLPLPARLAGIIVVFAPMFVHHPWRHAHILLVGAIVTPGRRVVTSVLRIMRRAQMRRFVNVYRILNRAAWYPCSGSHILLGLLVDVFLQRGPVVLCFDEPIQNKAY